jgi:hypothetical protein
VALLIAASKPPRLGYLDCDKEQVLCAAWVAGVPAIWHFTVPQATRGASAQAPGQASGPTHLHNSVVDRYPENPYRKDVPQGGRIYRLSSPDRWLRGQVWLNAAIGIRVVVLWNDTKLDDDDWNQLHQQADYEQKNGQENGCHAYCAAPETRLDSRSLIGVYLLA